MENSVSVIVSLAMLKANADMLRKDYLENFVPLVAECLRASDAEIVSASDVQQQLRQRFGLTIPQHAITSILTRLAGREYLTLKGKTRNSKVYVPNREKLEGCSFQDVQQQALVEQEALIGHLVTYANERCKQTWDAQQAEVALLAYLNENQLQMARSAVDGGLLPDVPEATNVDRFVVASFIRHVQTTQSVDFNYLLKVVMGNMLACALFLPAPNQSLKYFRQTEVYFDTSFLIRSLGYWGPTHQQPCLELLRMLRDAGAQLRVFKHTVSEIEGTLMKSARRLRQLATRDIDGVWYESDEYFARQGCTPSDVCLLASHLPGNLEDIGIRIVDVPAYSEYAYVIDEQGLADVLRNEVNYHSDTALEADVASYSAVCRLRRGQRITDVEKCYALFVTTNTRLVRATGRYYAREASARKAVAPFITDGDLTVMVWLKSPVLAPDLPRNRIIADCYAATRPSPALWARFVAELNKLENLGKVSTEDCYALRFSQETQDAVMTATLGDVAALTFGTVAEIVDNIKLRYQRDLLEQLQVKEEQVKQAEVARNEALAQVHQREVELKAERAQAVQASAQHAVEEAQAGFENQLVRWTQLQERRSVERTEAEVAHALRERDQRVRMRIQTRARRLARRTIATGIWSLRGALILVVVLLIRAAVDNPATTGATVSVIMAIVSVAVGVLSLVCGAPVIKSTEPVEDKVRQWWETWLLDIAVLELGAAAVHPVQEVASTTVEALSLPVETPGESR